MLKPNSVLAPVPYSAIKYADILHGIFQGCYIFENPRHVIHFPKLENKNRTCFNPFSVNPKFPGRSFFHRVVDAYKPLCRHDVIDEPSLDSVSKRGKFPQSEHFDLDIICSSFIRCECSNCRV